MPVCRKQNIPRWRHGRRYAAFRGKAKATGGYPGLGDLAKPKILKGQTHNQILDMFADAPHKTPCARRLPNNCLMRAVRRARHSVRNAACRINIVRLSDGFSRVVARHREASGLSRAASALARLAGLHQTYIGCWSVAPVAQCGPR